jgi:prevent-host-death family protein
MARKRRTETRVEADEAKTRFGELVSEVESLGISITITRRGLPVARLVPASRSTTPAPVDLAKVLEEFMAFRDAHPLNGITTRELVQDRRRM